MGEKRAESLSVKKNLDIDAILLYCYSMLWALPNDELNYITKVTFRDILKIRVDSDILKFFEQI